MPGADTLRVIDIDDDNDLDVIGGANNPTMALNLFENDGGLGAPQPIAYSDGVASVDVADFDVDGNLDLLVNGSNVVRVITGLGGGSFGAASTLPLTVQNSRRTHAADLDGDGRPEALAVGFNSQDFNLVFNLGRRPGTGDDFDLWTGVRNGDLPANDLKSANAGEFLTATMISRRGTFDGIVAPLLAGQLFVTGMPPASPIANIYIDPFGTPAPVLLLGGTNATLPALLPPGGMSAAFAIPAGLTGTSLMLQGIAPTGLAANAIYAASDGHEIVLL